jgi:outer membrane protein TolC
MKWNRKLTAALLALAMIVSLGAVSALAADEGDAAASSAIAAAAESTSSSAASSSASADASADGASAAAGAMTSVQNAPKPAEGNTSNEAIQFSQVRTAVLKYNTTVLNLQTQLAEVNNTSLPDLSTGSIDSLIQELTESRAALEGVGGSDLSTAVFNLINSQLVVMNSQRMSMISQQQSLYTNVNSAKNTVEGSINQIAKGAESLYIAIVGLEQSAKDLQRNLDAMNRAVVILEKQHELGMASEYAVETQKYNRDQLQSSLDSLNYQIEANKVSLENMCGMKLTGKVKLTIPEAPSQADLDAVSYDKTLTHATEQNMNVANAEIAYDNSENGQYGINRTALQAAVNTFAASYKGICLAVPEKARLLDVAKETLTYQQHTFAIAEKQYQQGQLSKESYLQAQSALESAENSVAVAQIELVSAYNDYTWAMQHGVV